MGHHYPHRIRLRGPWECEPLQRLTAPGARPEPLPKPLRMTMPCCWREGGLGEFAGRVRFTRSFGYPGRIDPGERVWLTFAGIEGVAEVSLNGHPLGHHEAGPFDHEVTPLLGERNRLVVEIEESTGRGGLWGEVALEIRRTAFLRRVQAWVTRVNPSGQVEIAGEVVGTAERPLDLYVLVDGANCAYRTVAPSPGGEPFRVAGEPPAGEVREGALVRVELVDAATVWYAVEVPLAVAPGNLSETRGADGE
jgi:hypothetical protein